MRALGQFVILLFCVSVLYFNMCQAALVFCDSHSNRDFVLMFAFKLQCDRELILRVSLKSIVRAHAHNIVFKNANRPEFCRSMYLRGMLVLTVV